METADRSLPASTEAAIVGRVPSAWLMENMHSFSPDVFYDKSLSEDNLKAMLAKRTSQ